jgi:hypothetical protein
MYNKGDWLKARMGYSTYESPKIQIFKGEFYQINSFIIFDGLPYVFLEEIPKKSFPLSIFTTVSRDLSTGSLEAWKKISDTI